MFFSSPRQEDSLTAYALSSLPVNTMGSCSTKEGLGGKHALQAMCTDVSRIQVDEGIFLENRLTKYMDVMTKILDGLTKPTDLHSCVDREETWFTVGINYTPGHPPGRSHDVLVYDDGSMTLGFYVRHNSHIGRFGIHPRHPSDELRVSLLKFQPKDTKQARTASLVAVAGTSA